MKETRLMGRTSGAVIVQMTSRWRLGGRGSVTCVSLGSVERNSTAMGAEVLEFLPSCRLTGEPAKALASQLFEVAHQRKGITAEARMDAIDNAILMGLWRRVEAD